MDELLRIENWGGDQYIIKKNNHYHLFRSYGLFSNITVATYGILRFTLSGHTPSKLYFALYEYDYRDFYSDLFKNSNLDFDISDISKDELDNFMRFCEPNSLGLGRRKSDINFKILDRVNKKFFNLSDAVINTIKNIEINHNIDYDNTVFIWARKTDKISETNIPDVDDYINLFNSLNLKNKDVILQTDDIKVYNEFISKGFKFKFLNEIPINDDNSNGFHVGLCYVTEEDFIKTFKMSKTEYLQKLLSLVHIASKCHSVITYPGCLATYIPIIRGNWDNVYSFQDKSTLILD